MSNSDINYVMRNIESVHADADAPLWYPDTPMKKPPTKRPPPIRRERDHQKCRNPSTRPFPRLVLPN